ncbi:MAG: DUF4395 domain-containing protein [Acidimicrobiia bacterium]
MTGSVDVNVPRFNQACVAALTGLAFITQWWPLVACVAIVLALTRFAGPRYGLFTQTYLRFVKPRLEGTVETEPSGPPRFAQLLGVVFLGLATMSFVLGASIVGWVLTLMVTALAALAATTKICVGCVIYERATVDR